MARPPPCSPREGAPLSSAGPAGGFGALPVPGRDPSAGRTLRPPCTDPACLHQGPCIAVLRRGGTLVPPSGGRTWEARLVTVQVTPLPGQWQQRRHPGCWSPASWSAPVGARPPPPKLAGSPGETPGVPQSRKPVNSLPSASRWAGLLRTGPRASASPAVGGFRNRGGEKPPVSQRRRRTRASVLPKAPSRALARMRRALLGLLA